MARKKTATMNDDGVITPEEPVVFQTMPLERMDTLSEMYPDLFHASVGPEPGSDTSSPQEGQNLASGETEAPH